MKRQNIIILLATLLNLVGAKAFAQNEVYFDVEVEGLYYRLTNDSYYDEASYTYYDGTATIVNPSGDDGNSWEIQPAAYQENGELIIPSSITVYDDNYESWDSEYQKTYCVTAIGKKAFYGCWISASVFVPSSVTMIDDNAFSHSYGLTSINIPNSVTKIGNSAFNGCSNLASVDIPASVTSIGDDTFSGCSSMSSLTIPNTVISIGKSAFARCSNLKILNIPNSVTSIEDGAFSGCSSLTSVYIPISVTNIGRHAFYGCSGKLTVNCNIVNNAFSSSSFNEVIIGNDVTDIGSYAFSYCSHLTNISIPNCVTSIGYQAFYYCNNLANMTIGNSVARIGNEAFEGTAWYENQPNGLVYAGRVAYKYKGTMPTNTSITLKEGTLGVADKAFYECDKLTAIIIPEGVTTIGSYAFRGCSGLTSVTVKTKEPLCINDLTFTNRTNATLYVPAGSKATYEAADYWKDFKEIVEMESFPIATTDISQIDNIIYIEPTEERTGTETFISFKMKNTAAIRGFQFDLELPEGVTPVEDGGEYVYWLNVDRAPKKAGGQFYHTLEVTKQADGSYRFLCGAQADKTFIGNDGEVAVLKVNVADDMKEGDYPIILKNVKLTETDISHYYLTNEVVAKLTIVIYEPGDISNDGIVDVSDYIGVANHILGNTPAGFNARAADVNNDNVIDVSDYIGIANIILTGSIYGNSNARNVSLPKKEEQTKEPE